MGTLIIALGDTHGRPYWKEITAREEFDRVILIGDYFDSYGNYAAHKQIDNFRDLVAFKKANPDKVILLFGNHDFHYLNVGEEYSGYQPMYQSDIREVLSDAIRNGDVQMCYSMDRLLFTHAGITKTWYRLQFDEEAGDDGKIIEENINELFKSRPTAFKFNMGPNRAQDGDDICQSPIWVRPNSLFLDKLSGFIHIVGHTSVSKLDIQSEPGIVLIDTLGTTKEYLVITDGVMSTKRL